MFHFLTANEFPSSFESIVRKIVRLLFHVVAHLYAAHFKEVVLLGLHAHVNLTFAHLTALQNRFSLIEPKETEVLKDLEVALKLTDSTTPEDICTALNENVDQSDVKISPESTGQSLLYNYNYENVHVGDGWSKSNAVTNKNTVLY